MKEKSPVQRIWELGEADHCAAAGRRNGVQHPCAMACGGSILFCLAFPNGQDLRPTEFAQHDFFIWLLQRIYAADTNTNVLPSMHVIGCAALTLACFDSQPLCKRHLQWVALPLGLLICASTVLVKQHSILDVFVAIPVSVILYFIVYHKTFRTMRQTA